MPLLNQFGPFSNCWHVAVNSDVKQTMQGMGVHDVVVHDVGCMTWACMTLPCITWPSMTWACLAWPCLAWTFIKRELFSAVKKLIFDTHFREKTPIRLIENIKPTLPTHPFRKNSRLMPLFAPLNSRETLK
jgi:hypothetical protein